MYKQEKIIAMWIIELKIINCYLSPLFGILTLSLPFVRLILSRISWQILTAECFHLNSNSFNLNFLPSHLHLPHSGTIRLQQLFLSIFVPNSKHLQWQLIVLKNVHCKQMLNAQHSLGLERISLFRKKEKIRKFFMNSIHWILLLFVISIMFVRIHYVLSLFSFERFLPQHIFI